MSADLVILSPHSPVNLTNTLMSSTPCANFDLSDLKSRVHVGPRAATFCDVVMAPPPPPLVKSTA
eukprot:5528001-Amphidinium_carterae.1